MSTEATTEISKCLALCPEISEKAQYWFFRTEGGYLYEAFFRQNSIAIGHPLVTLATLQNLPTNDKSRKQLSLQIRQSEPTNKSPGLSASQLLKFVHEMKEGDYVIIPSEASHELAIGILTDKPLFEKPIEVDGKPHAAFSKRRGVRWLRRVRRDAVNPNLFRILLSHQTITNITPCDQWIDAALYDFFKKGAKYHFVIDVARTGNINARDLFSACSGLLELGDEFASEINVREDSGDIDTRINLNSPGYIELITTASQYIFIIGIVVIGLSGGGLKGESKKLGIKIDLHTDGLIKAWTNFLNNHKHRKLLETVDQKVKTLQIQSPEELIKVLKHIDKSKP